MLIIHIRRSCLGFAAALGTAALLAAFFAGTGGGDEIDEAELGVLAGKVIAVDPGHGGIDSGARGNGHLEKAITLEIAEKLAERLRHHGAQVVMTRESDVDYYTRGKGGKRNDLLRRISIANSSGAQLFVSIHTNAIRGAQWSGAEVYYNPRWEENKKLALTLQNHLRDFPPGNKRQARQDCDILVLKDTTMPGVLIETGFLSNPQEAARLADPAYQEKMAEQIVRGLAHHLSRNVVR